MTKFSDEQKKLCRESWAELKQVGMQELGLLIFQRLFNDCPFIRILFYDFDIPDDESLTIERMKESKTLRTHAMRVATSITKVLKALDDPEELNALFTNLGQIHFDHKVEDEYFEYLAPVMLAVIGENLKLSSNSPILQAWVKAYGVIRNGIIKAMNEAEERHEKEQQLVKDEKDEEQLVKDCDPVKQDDEPVKDQKLVKDQSPLIAILKIPFMAQYVFLLITGWIRTPGF